MISKKQWARRTKSLRQKFGLVPESSNIKEQQAHLKKRRHGKTRCTPLLSSVIDNTSRIHPGDKVLLTMGKDEAKRIPYFLEYYRNLGIDHFLFIDNDSSKPMADLLEGMCDVSLWHTTDSYAGSQYGVDWMNALNSKYAVGHWILTVDLDEFFVFPYMEKRSFKELCNYLDNMEQKSMFAPLIDMYPNGSISDAVVSTGEDPLRYANYFDVAGYHAQHGGFDDVWLKGGPRCRLFNNGNIESSPSINKTPLIKWTEETLYIFSTHTAYPFELNHPHPKGVSSVTGALLHFKFISEMKEKAEYAVKHKNHYEGSKEYAEYLKVLAENENLSLICPHSAKYISSETLIDAKLINASLWGFEYNS
jgi:hypothetical protein